MATGGLYGSSSTGALVASPGSESAGLYGSNVNFGGTFFQWFIFQQASTQPATPTGGSWNFTTQVGTPPSGWSNSPPPAPTNEIWVSIAFVNSRSTSTLTWSVPGLLGVIASVNVGTTTTGAAGSSASVSNSGTPLDAILNFTIPRGDTGATGAAATIAAGTTTTTNPGTNATVTNVGTSGAAIFNFGIPRGAGVNSGGSVGQVLTKASGTDYDTTWTTITGTLNYQGTWNASTNTPTLTSSVGTNGYYYVVNVAGSTNLNGITDWQVGDWAIFNGSVWQKLDQTDVVTSVNGQTGTVVLTANDVGALSNVTSADGSVTITTPTTGVRDLSVQFATTTENVRVQVRNTTGATLTKGTVVYITGATGQLPTVSKALATSDATSAQTLGMISADLANNTNGYVTVIGLITNIDTSAYADGAQLYLSGTTAGGVTTTKPYAPIHLVYVGVVEHAHPTQGKIFVKVQNGYELDELHNVSAQTPSNGQTIIWNASTNLWEARNLTAGSGVSVTNGAGSITIANTAPDQTVAISSGTGISVTGTYPNFTVTNTSPSSGGTVTSVTSTSPVVSSGGNTPAISLASGYGDTQNPYASKTANFVLAAPNGTAGAPTFRAIVAADIPTLNQNTTGSAGSVANALTIGTGLTGTSYNGSAAVTVAIDSTVATLTGAQTLTNKTISGASNTLTNIGNSSLTNSSITINGSAISLGGSVTVAPQAGISNDIATATAVYPLFAAATSGTPTTIYTSNANYVYTPSTGELKAREIVASNGMLINADSVSSSYTVGTGNNALSVGPLTINSGVTLTIASGQRHIVI